MLANNFMKNKLQINSTITKTPQEKKWIEEFDKEFRFHSEDLAKDANFYGTQLRNELITFITKLLSSQKVELVKELNLKTQTPEMFDTNDIEKTKTFCAGYNACKNYVEWILNGRPTIESIKEKKG